MWRSSSDALLLRDRGVASLEVLVGRTKRGRASCTSLPDASGRAGLAADFSILAMRVTLTTSNARALWQIASTRPSPYFSQSESRA
jgi:hypothetical protein